jgi:hypothetical protein
MTERFAKAYGALYDAFINDRLQAGNCSACAIGSIIGSAQGSNFIYKKIGDYDMWMTEDSNHWWRKLFHTMRDHQYFNFEDSLNKRLIDITGYDAYEMSMIEYAFETNTKIKFYHECDDKYKLMEDQMNGLAAALEIMVELDNIEDAKFYKDRLKNKFIYQ